MTAQFSVVLPSGCPLSQFEYSGLNPLDEYTSWPSFSTSVRPIHNDYNLKNTITFPFQDHTKTFLCAVKEVFFMFINDQLCRNNTKQTLIYCQFKTCFRYIKMLCYKDELTNYVYFPFQAHKWRYFCSLTKIC